MYFMRHFISGAVAVFFLVSQATAQILMSGGTYSQNFDSLANTGIANTWTDNATLPGWYASKSVAPNAVTSFRADNGSANAGALYSYGATASTDRALGVLVSSTPGNIAFGLRFTNDTAFVQTNILVSFTAEQWRNANTLAQTLAFYYQTGTALTNSDGASALSWNSFSALSFITPVTGGSGVALDGTASANQTNFMNVLLSGVAVQPGQELFLRWLFARPGSGTSHSVAIDNFMVSFSAGTYTPPSNSPPVITVQPQSTTNNTGNTVSFTVTATGNPPPAYQWQSNNIAIPGATNTSFTLAGVTTNLTGSIYFVTVTNTAGSTNSQTVTLTVNPPATTTTPVTAGGTRILCIAAYNVEADISVSNAQPTFTNFVSTAAAGPPLPGLIAPPTNAAAVQLGGVVEGIGEEVVNGNAQPLDILTLEETTSNPLTVTPIVNGLNTFYGVAGMYSNSSYQATESSGDPSTGNGPNAIVFNTRTVQLLASMPIDPPGGTSQLGGVSSGNSGEYREVMRYQFAPAGVATNAANIFYIYVSHYKSGDASTANNTNSRAGEAFIVRSNMVTALPPTARILHVGDFNTGEADELMYAILTAPGTNQLLDPLNPADSLTTNWDGDVKSYLPAKTDSVIALEYRDDYQMMTTNVYFGTSGGLALVPGTYHPFGNNGTTAYLGSANSGLNTALNNHLVTNGPVFISAAQLYVDLTGGADHLPVVADYTIPMPAPVITSINLVGMNLVLNVTNGITNGVYTLLMTTNIATPLANWTTVATNVASGGNFTFTAPNAATQKTPQSFFILCGN
jgi:hypothetical protein